MAEARKDASAPRYRTIVADPPWHYEGFAIRQGHRGSVAVKPLPYPSMSIEEIEALPIADLAARDCRIFLWTTNRYLPAAFDVLRSWGFEYRQALVWHKTDANLPAHVAPNSAEFVLVGVRGKPERCGVMPSAVLAIGIGGRVGHSTKPEAFLDWFERVSPGPYLELFARRNRLGWDTWGNEALEHVEMDA